MNRHRESQERWVQKMIFRINKNIAKEQVTHENILGNLNNATRNRIKEQHSLVLEYQNKLRRNTQQIQSAQAQKLDTIADTLRLLDPQQLLKRGYSITSNENGILRSIAHMKPGDRIITQLIDGSFTSTINEL